MDTIGHPQAGAHPARHRPEMIGNTLRNPSTAIAELLRTQGFGHLAHIDGHRTPCGTHAACGTGIEAWVLIGLLECSDLLRITTRGAQAGNFTQCNNALAGCEGQIARGAYGLAESALDAFVNHRMGRGQRL